MSRRKATGQQPSQKATRAPREPAEHYRLEPLAKALGVSFDEPDADGVCRGATTLAKLLGLPVDTIRNWRRRGIPASVDVDTLSVRVGIWAGSVWSEWGSVGAIDPDMDESRDDFYADDPPFETLETRSRRPLQRPQNDLGNALLDADAEQDHTQHQTHTGKRRSTRRSAA